MAFRMPVEEGGTAGRLVKIASGGHELDDGPFTLADNGTTATEVHAAQKGDGAAGQPDNITPFWLNIGQDSSGNELFFKVFRNVA